jgi:WhiB family transcriptional regulator, redox-sensing transcriptional regulator
MRLAGPGIDVGGGIVSVQRADETWQKKAACRGPQAIVFFPPSTFERKDDRVEREVRAKSICHECSVAQACLAYALRIREPHGIWGGLNELERRELLARADTN